MKRYKAIALMLAVIYFTVIPISSMVQAATSGAYSSGYSAEDKELVNKWKGYGLLDSSFDMTELQKPIQKIDFLLYLNSIFLPSKKAEVKYEDVPSGSWYGDEIAKAIASGFIPNSNKGRFNPFSSITRLDASIILSNAFDLKLKDNKIINSITDAKNINSSDLNAFAAVIERGFLQSVNDGRYAPSGVLRLADALKMLDKAMGQLVSKAGTINSNANGNMLINAGGVNLKNMTVSGDLIIAEGVGEGHINIERVSILGNLIIRGGGPNSVVLKNSVLKNNLTVEKGSGNVNVVTEGTTTIDDTFMNSGGSLVERNLTSGQGFVNVTAANSLPGDQNARLLGDFSVISLAANNMGLSLEGSAKGVTIKKEANGSSFRLSSGSVDTLTAESSKDIIEILGGSVNNLKVADGAKANKITISNSSVGTIDIKDNSSITVEKATIKKVNVEASAIGSYINLKNDAQVKDLVVYSAATVTGNGKVENAYIYSNNVSMEMKPTGTYVSSNPSSGTSTPIDNSMPSVMIGAGDITVKEGTTLNSAISIYPTDSTVTYSSSDNSVATITEKGVITGVAAGSTTINVIAQKAGYKTAVKSFKVTVGSSNITPEGTLAISPTTAETATLQDFVITYTANGSMSNGTVVIRLPAGFMVNEYDSVSINKGEFKTLEQSQRPDIQTISITNLNLVSGNTIEVKLKNKMVPAGGDYTFTAVSDADGMGPIIPTPGNEKCVFSSNSLRQLLLNINYSTPEYGATGGTTRISTLSTAGLSGCSKWVVAVSNDAFTTPKFNDVLSGNGYTDYTVGTSIAVTAGQNLRIAAVDSSNQVKAYKDIQITSSMVRPYNATGLEIGTNYNAPKTGVQAYTTMIDGLDMSNVSGGAIKWMVKVQNSAAVDVFVDSTLSGANSYTEGSDIQVSEGQHIILAATDASDKIKAYSDIVVTADMISKSAGSLILDNNYSAPEFGSAVGSTKIESLDKGTFDINKWMVVTLTGAAIRPAIDADITEYQQKYTGGKLFADYSAGQDITGATIGNHLLLVGVKDNSSKQVIRAYTDIVIDSTVIRQSDAIEIPYINYSLPEMGTVAGTTMISNLNLARPVSGSALSADVTKFMYKVQSEVFAIPQLNSILSGAKDIVSKQNIQISAGQHLIIIATDANGRIKAYKDFTVSSSQIRPADALKLIPPNDYSEPYVGSQVGTTRVILSSAGIPGFTTGCKWVIKKQSTAFEIPYKGQVISGTTDYTPGADITVTVGQHLLILAVDASGGTLAYADTLISYEQIKQPAATILKSSAEVATGESYNFSEPEPGQVGNTMRIASLNTMGIQGATRWAYKISDTSCAAIDYNTIMSGIIAYVQGDSVTIKSGQHFILLAIDSTSRVKGYRDILIKDSQIRTPGADLLISPTNYVTPTPGSTQGTTNISSLSFAGLNDSAGLTWKYIVGDNMFAAPARDTSASSIGTVNDLTVTTDIPVKSGQYILLLAVNGDKIKAYASINVLQSSIRPFNADTIPIENYNITKGTAESSAKFDKLVLTGIIGATGWMIKVQKDPFTAPAKDMTVTGSTTYSLNKDITLSENWHVLLLATDAQGRVKAYANIQLSKDQIQAPFATLLTKTTNYTDPEPGTTASSLRIMLNDAGIQRSEGETVVWKYKKGTDSFAIPILDDSSAGSEYIGYTSNSDIVASAGNSIMIVATINNKIKAYKQFTVTSTMLRPANAPELVIDLNYVMPAPGSAPGTTKLDKLNLIGVLGSPTKFVIKVVDAGNQSVLALDTVFTSPVIYAPGIDIIVKKGQYVVLAAIDDNGRIKAYKNILIDQDSYLNPPLAAPLTAGVNYGEFKYGSQVGTTSVYVSLTGLSGATDYVAKVTDAPQTVMANSIINYTTTGPALEYVKYLNYQQYVSGSDIAVKPGQYITLVAVNASKAAIAYTCVGADEAVVRPADAAQLKNPENYVTPVPGSAVGTTKINDLNVLGIAGAEKWNIKVQDNNLSAVPLVNSIVSGSVVYDEGKDISAKEGQYIILYAVDAAGKVKGYASIKVSIDYLRGLAPLLTVQSAGVPDYNYTLPVPGTMINTTVFEDLKLPAGATKWKYAVQDNAPVQVLKDNILTGLSDYIAGSDITAQVGQHIVLVATDNDGLTKAYADIIATDKNIRNVEATILGTVVSVPTGEANIASGGKTLIIKLAYGQWSDDVISNSTKRNALFNGLVAASEPAEWGKVVNALMNEGASTLSINAQNDTLTITLSEAATYNITQTQEIKVSLVPGLIKNCSKTITGKNSVTIAADVIVSLDGTAVTQGLAEGDIITGNRTLIINLVNGEFAQDVASTESKRNAIYNGITATNDTAKWAEVVTALKNSGEGAITRNSKSKLTITFPAVPGYDITMNEILSIKLPCKTTSGEAILVGAIKDVIIPSQLIISANASSSLSGTLLDLTSEVNIQNGGKTLIVTLSDGQWAPDVATDSVKRDALFAGLVSSTEQTVWAKVVAALKTAGASAIARTSNTAITIMLPPVAGYDITQTQNVTLNIPGACIVGAKANLIAKQTITIERIATATLGGTAVGSNIDETAIRSGYKTITITLNNGTTWRDEITTDSNLQRAVLKGFKADFEQSDWDLVTEEVLKDPSNITKTSTNTITIMLQPVSGYYLNTKQTISLSITSAAAIGTSFNIAATNSIVINNTPPVPAKVIEVTAPTGSYKTGDVIPISIKFDTPVDVIGTPLLALQTGTTSRNASYTTGSGIDTLTFTYTVQSGDSSQDLEYKSTSALSLTGATIRNKSSSVNATVTLPSPGASGSLGSTSNVLVDAIAPKLVSGYPKAGTKTEASTNVILKVDKKSKLYYIVVPTSAGTAAPAPGEIIQLTGSAVSYAAVSGSLDAEANIEVTASIEGLNANTSYVLYFAAKDAVGNISTGVSTISITTLDMTAPVIITNYPAIKLPQMDSTISVLIKTNEDGKAYMIAVPVGSTAPSTAQIKAGKNAAGVAVAANLKVTAALVKDTEAELTLSGLPVSTAYDLYIACEDTALNMASLPAVVTATTSKLNLNNVGIDLAKGIITNTTVQMEYSFNDANWKPCTAISTGINVDDAADILAVFVREKYNEANSTQVAIAVRESTDTVKAILGRVSYNIAEGKITNASDVNLQYRINGGSWGTLNASSSALNVAFEAGLLEVRAAAVQNMLPSQPVSLDNIAVPMPAPELEYDDKLNTVLGLDNTYEYRVNGGTWTTGASEGLFTGTKTVEIRQKATKDKLYSLIQTVRFTADALIAVAYPAALSSNAKSTVTITFDENTNKKALSVQDVRTYIKVGVWDASGSEIELHDWGTDFTAQWNTTGNALSIVYNTISGSSIRIGDEIRVTSGAGIKNSAGTSNSYTADGILTGSFHTIPAIASVKAYNSGNQIGFGNGDKLVITFDQPTNRSTITAISIDGYLQLSGGHKWGVTTDSAIQWSSDGTQLSITFNDITKSTLTLSDKITINKTWALRDKDMTTEVSQSSSYISGSFTSTPTIASIVISDGGNPGTMNPGDKVTITFDQVTNKKPIRAYQLNTWLKLTSSSGAAHSWGVQSDSDITWSADGTKLIIELSNIAGVTLASGDTLTLSTLAGIKDEDSTTPASGASKAVTGGY